MAAVSHARAAAKREHNKSQEEATEPTFQTRSGRRVKAPSFSPENTRSQSPKNVPPKRLKSTNNSQSDSQPQHNSDSSNGECNGETVGTRHCKPLRNSASTDKPSVKELESSPNSDLQRDHSFDEGSIRKSPRKGGVKAVPFTSALKDDFNPDGRLTEFTDYLASIIPKNTRRTRLTRAQKDNSETENVNSCSQKEFFGVQYDDVSEKEATENKLYSKMELNVRNSGSNNLCVEAVDINDINDGARNVSADVAGRRRGKGKASVSILERLASTPGYVNKVDVEDGPRLRQRPQRMASLNAMAKVNLLYEPSSPLAGRSLTEIHQNSKKSNYRNVSMELEDRKVSDAGILSIEGGHASRDPYLESLMYGSCDYEKLLRDESKVVPLNQGTATFVVDNNVQQSVENSLFNRTRVTSGKRESSFEVELESLRKKQPRLCDGNQENKKPINSAIQKNDIGISAKPEVKSRKPLMVDACIQVDIPHLNRKEVYMPCGSINFLSRTIALPVEGTVSTNDGARVAVPFTKTHLVSPIHASKPPSQFKATKIENKEIIKLSSQAMYNALCTLNKPLELIKNHSKQKDINGSKPSRVLKGSKLETKLAAIGLIPSSLRIPKITFAATSTSTFSSGGRKSANPVKSLHLKNLSAQLEKFVTEGGKMEPFNTKRTNGWQFIGEPLEKPYPYDDIIALRRYYTGIKRNFEIINVRDSVLLKSGPRKKDSPYVARVAGLWEEEGGPNAGEMMMSVFWYYRPEQTEIGRLPEFHGETEVLASRHKDDNSVACVVDKCYVLSYPEYCRFRGLAKRYQEARLASPTPVPPGESTRPGTFPPPSTDPSMVFFCRQVYDHRTGRILKNPPA